MSDEITSSSPERGSKSVDNFGYAEPETKEGNEKKNKEKQ